MRFLISCDRELCFLPKKKLHARRARTDDGVDAIATGDQRINAIGGSDDVPTTDTE
jgi:hypothetical protein